MYAALTMSMRARPQAGGGELEMFDAEIAQRGFLLQAADSGLSQMSWRAPSGNLSLLYDVNVKTFQEHDRNFRATIDGREAPRVRLSDEPLKIAQRA